MGGHIRSDRERKAMFSNMNNSNPRRSSHNPPTELVNPNENRNPKGMSKNIPDFVNKKVLTEREIKLLQRRLNDKKIVETDIFGRNFDRPKRITQEQTKKGLDWLDDKRRTPTGKERLNNPFGQREEAILDNFDHFELKEFFDSGNQFVSFKIPLWEVVSKDGQSFEYHSQGGKVNITG